MLNDMHFLLFFHMLMIILAAAAARGISFSVPAKGLSTGAIIGISVGGSIALTCLCFCLQGGCEGYEANKVARRHQEQHAHFASDIRQAHVSVLASNCVTTTTVEVVSSSPTDGLYSSIRNKTRLNEAPDLYFEKMNMTFAIDRISRLTGHYLWTIGGGGVRDSDTVETREGVHLDNFIIQAGLVSKLGKAYWVTHYGGDNPAGLFILSTGTWDFAQNMFTGDWQDTDGRVGKYLICKLRGGRQPDYNSIPVNSPDAMREVICPLVDSRTPEGIDPDHTTEAITDIESGTTGVPQWRGSNEKVKSHRDSEVMCSLVESRMPEGIDTDHTTEDKTDIESGTTWQGGPHGRSSNEKVKSHHDGLPHEHEHGPRRHHHHKHHHRTDENLHDGNKHHHLKGSKRSCRLTISSFLYPGIVSPLFYIILVPPHTILDPVSFTDRS